MKKIILFSFIIIVNSLYAGQSKINAEIQMMNGKAGEYVYSPETGDKASYLDWRIKNIPIIKINYDYMKDNFEFSINAKKNISKNFKSGYMKDYDWYLTPEEEEAVPYSTYSTEKEAREKAEPNDKVEKNEDGTWTLYYVPKDKDRGKRSNFSKNKNYVKNIMGIDLSIKYYLKNSKKIKVAPILGINYDKYEFYGLTGDQFNYIPNKGYTLDKGDYKKSITYKQKFLTPYLGLNVSYSPNIKWEVNWLLKGSCFTKAEAIDRHLERGSKETVEKYKNMKYLSSNLVVKYNYNENFSVNLGIEAVKYFKNRKSTVRFTPDKVTDESPIETLKNISGIKNHNISYSLGFAYKF